MRGERNPLVGFDKLMLGLCLFVAFGFFSAQGQTASYQLYPLGFVGGRSRFSDRFKQSRRLGFGEHTGRTRRFECLGSSHG
jgi:hypothetical protein